MATGEEIMKWVEQLHPQAVLYLLYKLTEPPKGENPSPQEYLDMVRNKKHLDKKWFDSWWNVNQYTIETHFYLDMYIRGELIYAPDLLQESAVGPLEPLYDKKDDTKVVFAVKLNPFGIRSGRITPAQQARKDARKRNLIAVATFFAKGLIICGLIAALIFFLSVIF